MAMNLRHQPLSERLFASFVLLALAAFLVGGLVFSLRQDLGRSAQVPGTNPRLLAVLEGVMASNVTPAEAATFRTWVATGATREGYTPVEAIVGNNCASCHGPGGQFPRLTSYEDVRPLAMEAAPEGLFAAIGTRALHLVLFPLTFLVAGLGYLRRSTWRWRRTFLGVCGVVLLGDAAAWWLRQEHPGALWTAWTSLAVLPLAYLVLATVVGMDLWGSPSE